SRASSRRATISASGRLGRVLLLGFEGLGDAAQQELLVRRPRGLADDVVEPGLQQSSRAAFWPRLDLRRGKARDLRFGDNYRTSATVVVRQSPWYCGKLMPRSTSCCSLK